MHKPFDHKAIEKKWQDSWEKSGIYNVGARDAAKKKEYVMVEWPYPSGNLHTGHWYAFAVPDIYVRKHRMEGMQVLFPMGFDAFGLPAENAAIKRNLDPKQWTDENIAFMKGQLKSMGNAFSWDKTTSSTDPQYYKWTQWMFTQFFEKGIAYRGTGIVNWCPGCNTVIANEQVLADGTCERSGDVIVKREMPQWLLKITDYADRLVDDLDGLSWPEAIKESQRNWIGRSKGAMIDFVLSTGDTATVFTTRADTLCGVTFLVLAPEHPLVERCKGAIKNWDEALAYRTAAAQRDEIERTAADKEKTGVRLDGITAKNPVNGEDIPVYIADYVLASYGTGAIMAVPAHDERDNAFAKKFNLPIREVLAVKYVLDGRNAEQEGVETLNRTVVDAIIHDADDNFYLIQEPNGDVHFPGGGIDEGEADIDAVKREVAEETGFTDVTVGTKITPPVICWGFRHTKQKNQRTIGCAYEVTINSGAKTHSEVDDGDHELIKVPRASLLESISPEWKGHRFFAEQYLKTSLHTGNGVLINSGEFDGLDSEEAKIAIVTKVGGHMTNTYRLRDWSIGRQRYWGVPIPIVYDPEGKAHVVPQEHLPWRLPTDVDFTPTGEPPLAKSKELKERTEKIFGTGWTPDYETMDTFVDSSWYFLRYVDNANDSELSSRAAQEAWMPVDIYFGGAEHTTMHLLYSRFWQKALYDLGLVVHEEPYKLRINRGLVLGTDGNKMSKSKGNVIDPDTEVSRLGADTVRMYLAFMGPYGQTSNYPWDMGGIAGLRRFLERVNGLSSHVVAEESAEMTTLLHQTIKKVSDDIEAFKFNTAITALMIYLNTAERAGVSADAYGTFLQLLAPFAPHLSEELWADAKREGSLHMSVWPVADAALLATQNVTIAVQVNGKTRGTVVVPNDSDEETVLKVAMDDERVRAHIEKVAKDKVIFVTNKVINIIGGPASG